MFNIDKDMYDTFIIENKERLSSLEKSLSILKHDPANINAINDIKRSLHTTKSEFAILKFQKVVNACHQAETAIIKLEKNGYVDSHSLNILVSFVDKLVDLITFISNMKVKDFTLESSKKIGNMKEFDFSALMADLDNISNENINLGNNYDILVKFDPTYTLINDKVFQVLKSLESIAKIVSSVPALIDLEKDITQQDMKIKIISNEDEKAIVQVISSVPDVFDVVIGQTDEKTIYPDTSSSLAQPISLLESIRVQLADLDLMMDMLGELVIEKNALAQHLALLTNNQDLDQFIGMDKAITSLRNLIIRTRLIPLEYLYEQLPRIIRETSRIANKKCEPIFRGKHIEIDRSKIDLLNEALIHLLRNAIDHGIEPAEERKKKNKSETGKIIIEATVDKNDVIIIVEDDGAGINIPLLKQRAEQKGVIPRNATISQDDLWPLLFLSGSSTSDQVTELSGRGIGLNIVYTNIVEKLQGTIHVETQEDKGTKFTLRISNSLPIFRALSVQVNNKKFFISMSDIRKIYHITSEKIFYQNTKPFIIVKQELIPIILLKQKYNLGYSSNDDE